MNVRIESKYDFEGTFDNISNFLNSKGFTIFCVVDHGKNAKDARLDFINSKLIIFGNAKGGTILMKKNAELGIELPLKILIIEQDKRCYVIYKDYAQISKEYNLDNKDIIDQISGLFQNLKGSLEMP